MKRFFYYVLTLIGAATLFLSSCQKAPELAITGLTNVEIGPDGGSATISFITNRDWAVSWSEPWINVSPSSGSGSKNPITISISCSANTIYDDRSGVVTIKAEDLTQTVSVKQLAKLGLIVPTQTFNIQSGARTIEVEVQSNTQYTVDIADSWIKQTGTKGLTSKKLIFSIDANTTYDAREGKITIKPSTAASGIQDQIISVKQAQRDALNIKDSYFNMPYGGGGIEIKVEANDEFIVTPNVNWIHYVQTKALSNFTVYLTVDENETYSTREGKVEITLQNGGLSHTITVKQECHIAVASLKLNKNTLSLIKGESETLDVTISPDNATDKTLEWASSNPSVVTVNDNGKVVAASYGEATITVKAKDGNDVSATCSVFVSHACPEGAVDLGLISSDGYKLYWATRNIGASAPEDYGDKFAWGETEVDSMYWPQNYSLFKGEFDPNAGYDLEKILKYNLDASLGPVDNKIELDPEDDVAHVKWGGNWRMPNWDELDTLLKNCNWKWTTSNGKKGYKVTSKVTGYTDRWIFLPAAGYYAGTLGYTETDGYYWSSTLYTGDSWHARAIQFTESTARSHVQVRYLGYSVRPVYDGR